MCRRYALKAQIHGPFWASKWVKIQVFDYLVKTFPLDTHQSCNICSEELLVEMWTTWTPKAQLLAYFGPQSKSKYWTLVTFSNSLHWFHISIASHVHWKNLQWCVEYGLQRPNFGAILGPKISQSSGLRSFPQKVFTGFTSVLKGLRMVARALWRSEARRVVSWSETRHEP